MPRDSRGLQQITFAIVEDEDQEWNWVLIDIKKGDTIAKIAARRGYPEQARKIQERNRGRGGPRSINSEFSGRGLKRLRVPGAKDRFLHVTAGDRAPRITGGYAKLSVIDRPERTGLSVFEGYDPGTMEVPIRFEKSRLGRSGTDIEDDCRLLERMAGRGDFKGGSTGPPPVLRVYTTGPGGSTDIVPLIPHNWQWASDNEHAPVWRIAGIDWDDNPIRNGGGNRIRQLATVTLQEHVPITLATRSVVKRRRATKKKKPKPKSRK